MPEGGWALRAIRVVVVSDVRMHREGIAALLGSDDQLRVTTVASSVDGLRRVTAAADVVVVDTSLDDVADRIREIGGEAAPAIVAVGVPNDEPTVVAFAELGVLGFVEPEAPIGELVSSVLSAARREASFPPRIATTLLRRISSAATRRASSDASALTTRERQIVDLIAHGLSNKEIATRLFIEVATVKNHVHNILEKLQVSRRTDAVARLRLIEGGDSGAPTTPFQSRGPRPGWGSTGSRGSVARPPGA
jgi:two-component system, NarL family, nitrate/nitrite response regulator NarL